MSSVRVAAALTEPPDRLGSELSSIVEDQYFERKSIRSKPAGIAATEVAFANADGGTLVIGLHSGQVEGVDRYPEKASELLQAAINETVPPARTRHRYVDCQRADGTPDRLIVIEVDPSEIVHVTVRDDCFLRVGDESRRLTFHQRQELVYDKGQAHFDGTPVDGVSDVDLDSEVLNSFALAIRHPDPTRVLLARGLRTRTGRITAGGYLLFGSYPQDHFPGALVRVVRHRGRGRLTGARQQLVRDERCEGPIPRVLADAMALIQELQPARRALGGQGRFVLEGLIPQDAWLEGLVNAVVHRSYNLGGDHVRVDIFDDRIEIHSPGRFPGLVRVDDPRGVARFARNPRIARACSDLNYGQELGEGIRRIFEEMRLRGLAEPLYSQTTASVRLTLSAMVVSPEVAAHLPDRYMEIIDLLRNAGVLSTGAIAEALHLSKPPTIRRLRALQTAGLVDWVGNSVQDPRAVWRLHSE